MKTCTKCKVSKDLIQFCKKLDGLGPHCRACISISNAARWTANQTPEALLESASRRAQQSVRRTLLKKFDWLLCNQCIVVKSSKLFYPGSNSSLPAICKKCCCENEKRRKATNPEYPLQREREREKLRAHPEIKKGYHLKESFGISLDYYEQRLAEQGGKCAICKVDGTLLKRKLAVDHDHTTGKIRGLLCGLCNTSLGGFKDSPSLLASAIAYLTK